MDRFRPIFTLFTFSLRRDIRGRWLTIWQALFAGILLLILRSIRHDYSTLAAPGRDFLTFVMIVNLVAIALAGLSIFATTITEEKEDQMLPLLVMTGLNRTSILLGKSTSRLVNSLLLLAVQIPFTLLAITLGGVRAEQVWASYAILGSWLFFVCNLGLFASVISQSAAQAGLLTAAAGGVITLLVPYWLKELLYFYSRVNGDFLDPFSALFGVLENNQSIATPLIVQLIFNLTVGVGLFWLSYLCFDRYCMQSSTKEAKPSPVIPSPKLRGSLRPRPWYRIPLIWKDFHFIVGGPKFLSARAALALIATLLFTRGHLFSHFKDAGIFMFALCTTCAFFEVSILAGRILSFERQERALSSLVLLPIPTGRIVWHKVLGCLIGVIPWILCAMFGALMCWGSTTAVLRDAVSDIIRKPQLILPIIHTVLQFGFFLLLIMWFSLISRIGILSALATFAIWRCGMSLLPNGEPYGTIIKATCLTFVVKLLAENLPRGILSAAAEEK